MSDTEWLRLPEEGKRCTVTGLSPSSLTELLNERDPETGELLIRSIIKKKTGAKRGIRLINKRSLLNYLDLAADNQSGLVWAPHIVNSHDYPALLAGVTNCSRRELIRLSIACGSSKRPAAIMALS